MTKQKMKSDSLGDEKVKKVAPCFLNFSLIPVRTWQMFQDNTNNEIRVCNFFSILYRYGRRNSADFKMTRE